MYQFQQLKTAVSLISSYSGNGPFHIFLKHYFSENKKHGSSDRRNITAMCYAFFRMGKALTNEPIEERVLLGLLLLEDKNKELIKILRPEWAPIADVFLSEKLIAIKKDVVIFPYCEELSKSLDCKSFNNSFLLQPSLFIRVRPGYHKMVNEKLVNARIVFAARGEDGIELPANTKLDQILLVGKEVIVQDLNSQKINDFMFPLEQSENWECSVWDCCAASGGKSIMAYDRNKNLKLTVSDIRAQILENLNKRFTEAGIKNYTSFIADLGGDELKIGSIKDNGKKVPFDFIIADVPCTGSGTWARTPENLFYFNKQQINKYAALQQKIIDHSISYLASGGHYLYITCSVFKKENEEQVAYIKKVHKLKLVKEEVLKGYDKKADSMFAALFTAS